MSENTFTILILLIIALIIAIAVLLVRLITLKMEFKKIKTELQLNKANDYNKQLSISLIDSDMNNMVAEFNNNLTYQKKLKEKAEQAEGTMRQSVADIAHDLRTPLTVIKGNLQMLAQDEGLSESSRKYVDICTTQSDTLKTMVDDFFELSVLESDDSMADLVMLDATAELIQFIIENEAVIRNNNLEPDIKIPETKVLIKANEKMFQRVLSNLLNNVIKYAKDSFELSLRTEGDKCLICFANKIDKEKELDPDRLFERTYRGAKERKAGGAGLGLHIVKLLCERQGGRAFASLENDVLRIYVEYKM